MPGNQRGYYRIYRRLTKRTSGPPITAAVKVSAVDEQAERIWGADTTRSRQLNIKKGLLLKSSLELNIFNINYTSTYTFFSLLLELKATVLRGVQVAPKMSLLSAYLEIARLATTINSMFAAIPVCMRMRACVCVCVCVCDIHTGQCSLQSWGI